MLLCETFLAILVIASCQYVEEDLEDSNQTKVWLETPLYLKQEYFCVS